MSLLSTILKLPSSSRKILEKIAVIDIGSNSVRMVVYDGLKRTPLPLFNEKVLCGLARGLDETGNLNPVGMESAKRAIKRFCFIARAMKVKKIYTIATSAVRDAKDGDLFRNEIEKFNDIQINIISGEEEARLSSLGILSSIYNPEGIVGDLGGGSLEISYIKKSGENISTGGFLSFPIGPLRLSGTEKNSAKIIDNYFEKVSLFKDFKNKNFYAVGGGFRALAKIHILKKKYPLRVLHNYKVKSAELEETIENILKMSVAQLKNINIIPENRIETLKNTSLVANKIINFLKPSDFIFSVHGIREGFLYDMLSDEEKIEDPLIACANDMMEHISTDARGKWPDFGYKLFKWSTPVFTKEPLQITRLRLAACIFSRIAWYEHTEYRAEMAFRTILDSEISGLSHNERVFLATIAFHRYKSSPDKNITAKIHSLLNKQQIAAAAIIGHTIRLGMVISGGAEEILDKCSLTKEKNKLILSLDRDCMEIAGESVNKRLAKLAESLKLEPQVQFKN